MTPFPIDPMWLAAGGILAVVAGFWTRVKSMAHSLSKVAIVSTSLDGATTMDVVRYMRIHYKWYQFSDFNVRSVHKTMLATGLSMWVPFKTPTENGLYHGPHGWCWIESHHTMMKVYALRGRFDFIQLVKDANAYDTEQRTKDNPDRFYVCKVIGSEKGAWAMGEAIKSINSRGDSGSVSESPAQPTSKSSDSDVPRTAQVFEDIDTSFMYDKALYTKTGRDDPFKGLFYSDDAMKEVEDARKWMKMGKWYAERSIPHRRGVMIYGPGGTGKSSFTKAMGESLGIPIYQFYLNTMSDQEFIREWGNMQTPCIALLEDFDNVFHGREPQTEHKALTFDCVLNQISGVASLNGVYLVVTTNHLEHVDPAMGVTQKGETGGVSTRPGRVDRVLFMGAAALSQRLRIAKHILRDWPSEVRDVVMKTDGLTPAQVQEHCIQIAYRKLTEEAEEIAVPIAEPDRIYEYTYVTSEGDEHNSSHNHEPRGARPPVLAKDRE